MDGTLPSSPTPFTPPTTEEDRLSWLRLIRSRRVGPATFARLLDEHGTAQAALEALPAIARAAGVEDYLPCPVDEARREIDRARKAGARLLCLGDADYPVALAAMPDPPPVLWAMGRGIMAMRPGLGIVGARAASSLGTRMARTLAEGAGAHGLVVVSGLARGIDTAAHGGALKTGTIAVMAGGVDVVYPAENAALAAAIADQGLRLSEQPMGLQPLARHFPRRNRLIAGLSRALVVIEAAEGSGSLITARDALDLGREVLAVPGHPADPRAAGANALIRDGATLVRGVEDVVTAMGLTPGAAMRPDTGWARGEGRDGAGGAELAGAADRAGAPRAVGARGHGSTGHGSAGNGSAGQRAAQQTPPDPHGADGGRPRALPVIDTLVLHRRILDALTAAPTPEDQLLRDLALPPSVVMPALLFLELDGRIQRREGGALVRV